MDPLSITASVAGILALTGTIISKGYACILRVKKNKSDVQAVLNEVAGFSGILVGLNARYLKTEDSDSTSLEWLSKCHETMWQDTIKDCEKTLKEIEAILEALSTANVIQLVVKGESKANKLEKLLSKLERFKSFFVLCLQLQNNDDSGQTSRLTREVLDLLNRLLYGQDFLMKQAELKEEYRKREKIINWLGPTTEAVQEDLVRSRDTNSGQWLLDRTEFLSWLTSDESARFWLWGVQGSGKTVIVSKIIDTIQNQCLEKGDVLLYHYCRFSESTDSSSERSVGALVAMLLGKVDDSIPIPESLSILSNRYRTSSYPSLEELQDPFCELCQHYSRVFVVIDGLDEIVDRSGMLKFLTELSVAAGSFRIFVASRPEVDLEYAFETYLTVAVTQADVQLDMETYVQQRLERLQIDEDEAVVVSELVERAQGMFLWAVCQIDHLSRIRTAITPDVLTALPRGLESTFEGILLRLEEEDQVLALDILRVIMFSHRPLDLSEVVEAAAMTPEIRNLKQLRKTALRRPTDVFQLCGSLIRQSRATGKIYLAHYSVQEFLSRPLLEKGRHNPFFLQEMKAQQKQFEACMSYLSLTDIASETFQESFRLAKDSDHVDSDIQMFTGFPFLDYAANHWPSHLRALGSEGMLLISPLLEGFLLSQSGSFESWALISQYIHGYYKFPEGLRPIHAAVLFGLEYLTVELLKHDPGCLNVQTTDGRTPLHVALENEHEWILDFLVQRGASLVIKDGKGRNPLHAAIESGSALAVTQLVTAGADVNVVQSDGGTAISVAVENRWDQLAGFLSTMADPKIILPDGRSLMHLAAQSGSLIWTTTLLESHEEQLIDAGDNNGWTPLHYAVDQGHPAIALKLISAKCLVNHPDKNGWTPLHAAIRRRHLECASLIIEAEWPGGRPGRRTRQTLSSRRSPELTETGEVSASRIRRGVRDLVERQRAPPDRSDSGKYGSLFNPQRSLPSDESSYRRGTFPIIPHQPSPLHLAVSESYLDGVKLLAKYTDKFGLLEADKLECLSIAVQSQNADLALILMKLVSHHLLGHELPKLLSLPLEAITEQAKAMFTIDEIYGRVIPSFSNLQESIATLIKVWPDPGGPLILGALRKIVLPKNRIEVARLLIENETSPSDVLMEKEENPLLHSAIETNDVEFAKFLVEKGANVNAQNKQGETPLLVLASQLPPQNQNPQHTSLHLAYFLVSKGADTQALDQRGRGLCHRAAAAGNEKLLDWALDTLQLLPNSRDNNSRTPLLLAVESGSVAVVRRLLQQIVSLNESDDYAGPERVIDAMEYANMRSSPLLRAMVNRAERKINVVTTLVETDEKAFAKLSLNRQKDLLDLRTAFYIEALCWAIDCDFSTAFTFLLPKIPKSAVSSIMNLDRDSVFHSAAAANGSEYLKTLLQTLAADSDRADVLRSTNAQGKTPLGLVIESGSWEKVAILLRSGAKATSQQSKILKEKGSKEVQELLLQYDCTERLRNEEDTSDQHPSSGKPTSQPNDQRESEDMYSAGGEVRTSARRNWHPFQRRVLPNTDDVSDDSS